MGRSKRLHYDMNEFTAAERKQGYNQTGYRRYFSKIKSSIRNRIVTLEWIPRYYVTSFRANNILVMVSCRVKNFGLKSFNVLRLFFVFFGRYRVFWRFLSPSYFHTYKYITEICEYITRTLYKYKYLMFSKWMRLGLNRCLVMGQNRVQCTICYRWPRVICTSVEGEYFICDSCSIN